MYQLESTVEPGPRRLKMGRWNSIHHGKAEDLPKPSCWGTIRSKA